MTSAADLDTLCINTIRTLCIDAVQKANSGHPGTAMAMAPVIYALWQKFLSYNPEDPIWPNRDRFVLSAGHASTLLYSMLHPQLNGLPPRLTVNHLGSKKREPRNNSMVGPTTKNSSCPT